MALWNLRSIPKQQTVYPGSGTTIVLLRVLHHKAKATIFNMVFDFQGIQKPTKSISISPPYVDASKTSGSEAIGRRVTTTKESEIASEPAELTPPGGLRAVSIVRVELKRKYVININVLKDAETRS